MSALAPDLLSPPLAVRSSATESAMVSRRVGNVCNVSDCPPNSPPFVTVTLRADKKMERAESIEFDEEHDRDVVLFAVKYTL